jgi:hypothetical protein
MGRAAHMGSTRRKALSSSFPMFAAWFSSHVSDEMLTSSGHLPAWSWTHELWMRTSSPTISGVSLRGFWNWMILATAAPQGGKNRRAIRGER